ncbi:MAG: hypothetical protein ACKVOM_02720 [Ferruginibacter sp.]
MKQIFSYLLGLLVISPLFLSVGCTGDSANKGKGKKKEEVAPAPAEVKISNLHFFLENSGSMAGYLNGGTEFKNIITNLATVLNGTQKTGGLKIYTISEKLEPYPGDHTKFIKDIATVPMANKKSSEMHKIFEQLAKSTGANDVTIFASDCILSFPDVDIKKNPRVNIENAPSTLRSYMKDVFQKFQKQGLVASMYAFQSQFNGTYFDYKNTKIPLTGKNRPFYIWVLGKKDYVQKVNDLLHKENSFQPMKEIHFGMSNEAIKNYAVVPSLAMGKQYKVLTPYKEVSEFEVTKTKPQDVFIALNLNGLDGYMQDAKYLQSNLSFPAGGKVTASVVAVKPILDWVGNIKNVKERDLVQSQFTHIVQLKVAQMVGTKADLEMLLPYKSDNWYEGWSVMDDSNIKTETAPKTFAFVHLVGGIKEAYQMNNTMENILSVKIPFSK